MQISFHGAAQTVTGSKHLIQLNNGTKILLDCGLFQGMGKQTDALNSNFGFDPASIQFLILSHAHIDHSGLLPKLVKDGFSGTIFCTPATKQLTEVLLLDSTEIQRSDIKFTNKKRAKQGLEPLAPLYDVADAEEVITLMQPVDYNINYKINNDIKVTFTDAGHIIGSAAVHLEITENGIPVSITFSGDIGRYKDAILRAPAAFAQSNYVIMESTYGDKLHDDIVNSVDQLNDWINKTCIQKKGKLIIPAFSVGRTQELLYFLNSLSNTGRLPKINVYVDSPLSGEATAVVKSYPNYFNDEVQHLLKTDKDPFDFEGLRFIESADESKALNFLTEPCIIIASSGMADAGRIKHHIRNNIHNPANTILMVGYCEPNSLGGRLIGGAKQVHIFGDEFDVIAQVGSMRSMSAHGDYEDLLQWLGCQNKQQLRQIFLVHGEFTVQQNFAERLSNNGYTNIVIPAQHSIHHL